MSRTYTSRRMKSKIAGRCRACGRPIAKGTEIFWDAVHGARHAECDGADHQDNSSFEDRECGDLAYEDRCYEQTRY